MIVVMFEDESTKMSFHTAEMECYLSKLWLVRCLLHIESRFPPETDLTISNPYRGV